jgi:nitrous oxidase accessory protein NosD
MVRSRALFVVLWPTVVILGAILTAPIAQAVAALAPGAVCGQQLSTVVTAPAGSTAVDPGVDSDLDTKTRAASAGTTFWLRAGIYTLGTDQFGQVVPKDGDKFIGAPGAVLDGRKANQYAFSGQAKDVTIQGLTVQGFVAPRDQGVVNHDSGDGWVIRDNTVQDNGGAGLMAGARQQVVHNCLKDNGQYGINAYQAAGGITGLVVEGNEIVGNNTDDWEKQVPGCGCTGGVKFWEVNGADITGNWVHDNRGPGLWADTNNNDFQIEHNLIEHNDGEAVFYEISYNLTLSGNTFRGNGVVSGKNYAAKGDNFPLATVYLSESGGESRVAARTAKIDIHDNLFDDNWSGITLWENADRFCGSPANTSSGTCTKEVSALSSCAQPGIATPPLYNDCRWKTQHVDIHANTFKFDPTAVGCTNGLCGRMAMLSNYGTYPDWSPYKGAAISQAITFDQDNHWRGNTYTGSWTFMPYDTSRTISPTKWQAAPYNQDACSSFTGAAPTC